MATTTQSKTSAFKTILYKFSNPRDAELIALISDLKHNYLPYTQQNARKQLQMIIDHLAAYQDLSNFRKKLHVSLSKEVVSHNPAISIRTQLMDRDVVAESKSCIFVRYNTIPEPASSQSAWLQRRG